MEQKRLARLITWNTGGAIPPPATPVSDGSHARPISATVSVRPRALALVESLAMHAGCDGKHRYDSFRQAEKSARMVRRWHGGRLHAYRCAVCRGFHVGSRF